MKVCTWCHGEKALGEFGPHPTYADGKFPYCKTCSRAAAIENGQLKSRAASRLGLGARQGGGSKWMALPLECRKAEMAYQRELDAAAGIPTDTEVTHVTKEYDAATAGGITTVYTLQQRREFQSKWSNAVHARDRRCIVSGSVKFTAAGHIKPVKVCRVFDRAGMADLNNGIVLRADLHQAFDQGYFTYNPGGWLIPASGFNIVAQVPLVRWKKTFTDEQQVYLEWHRENVFKGYTLE